MSAEHYFSASPSSAERPKRIRVPIAGSVVELNTAGGTFSPDHLDTGTATLLGSTPPPPVAGDLLDLGCGWGPIALTLATLSPEARVWAVDVNERSLDLTRRNAAELGLQNITAVHPDEVPADVRFATIWSNPPIRIGKNQLHDLLRQWIPRLDRDANAWLVVARSLGSDSLQRWLAEEFHEGFGVHRDATSKGFRVLSVRRRSAG